MILLGACKHCGESNGNVIDGLCPDCTKKLDGVVEFGGYVSTTIGIICAAVDVLVFETIHAGPFKLLLHVAGWIICMYMAYLAGAVAARFMVEKGKKASIAWAAVAVAVIVLSGFTPKGQAVEEVPRQQIEEEYETLSEEYDSLCAEIDKLRSEKKELQKKHQDLINCVESTMDKMVESNLYDKHEEVQDWWMLLSIDVVMHE